MADRVKKCPARLLESLDRYTDIEEFAVFGFVLSLESRLLLFQEFGDMCPDIFGGFP